MNTSSGGHYSTHMGFPCDSAGNESTHNAENLGLIPSWEDSLEKGKATHSSILAWRIPGQTGLYSPGDCKELDTTEQLSLSFNPYNQH